MGRLHNLFRCIGQAVCAKGVRGLIGAEPRFLKILELIRQLEREGRL